MEAGFHRNEQGEVADDEGNVYDEAYNLVRAALSAEFLEEFDKMKKRYPRLSDKEQGKLARGNIYKRNREAEQKKRRGK